MHLLTMANPRIKQKNQPFYIQIRHLCTVECPVKEGDYTSQAFRVTSEQPRYHLNAFSTLLPYQDLMLPGSSQCFSPSTFAFLERRSARFVDGPRVPGRP
uniref:Uncharacterized protein n=1 Tax=Lygus hesperus TaxID=30085 RepID=A0A146KTL8_LYGHE